MTFQAYQRTHGLGLALARLGRGEELAGLGHEVGFESSSGFREAFGRLFGAPPGSARDRRAVVASMLTSPLGPLVAAATERGVCMLEFADRRGLQGQAAALARSTGRAVVPGRNQHLEQLAAELGAWFARSRTAFSVPLDTAGTDFQTAVWRHLLTIPYGQTRSYEQVAHAVGRPRAQRAVGRANGQNRVSIVIPCHRVVQKDGGLRGYAGGLWRKRWLLELETSP
jgi:AraC family transcriptional regulator of adaptative response/methylated-DNA-[protein]-cysteine methyltransferase